MVYVRVRACACVRVQVPFPTQSGTQTGQNWESYVLVVIKVASPSLATAKIAKCGVRSFILTVRFLRPFFLFTFSSFLDNLVLFPFLFLRFFFRYLFSSF